MEFSFKNYGRSVIIHYFLQDVFYISLFIFVFFIFVDCFVKYIVLTIISIGVLTDLITLLNKIKCLNSFMMNNSKKIILQFEKNLSNALLRYKDLIFTDEFIFILSKLEFINYSDILSINSDTKIHWFAAYKNINTLFSFHSEITLNNGKSYNFDISVLDSAFYEEFKNIVMKKNGAIVWNDRKNRV